MKNMFRGGCLVAILLIVVSCAVRAETAHRVAAVLVSQESSIHTSLSNRDVYRLWVRPRHGVAFQAVAIDSYPSYAPPIPLHDLAKDATFSIKLTRTPYCDRTSDENQKPIRCFEIERGSWKGHRGPADQWWK